MPEAHRIARAAAGGQIHQRARHRRRRRDRDRGGAHHRVVQFAHRQRAHVEVDGIGGDGLAGGRHIGFRRRNERHLRRVLARCSVLRRLDQPHAQRAGHADRFQLRQCSLVFVDRRLQFAAVEADVCGVDEHGGNAGVDHRRFERAKTRHVEIIDKMPGGKHGAAIAFVIGRIKEFQHDLGGGEGHAIHFEVAGFLHLSIRDRYMRENGLADIGLPDPHRERAVVRDARGIDETVGDRERPDRGGEIAAVARPIDECTVDADLTVQIVHVVVRHGCRRDDHALAGRGRRPAHAVGVLAVGIGASDHPQQQRVAHRTGRMCFERQIFQAEEHAFRRAAAQVGGGDAALGSVGHGRLAVLPLPLAGEGWGEGGIRNTCGRWVGSVAAV